MEPRKVKFTLEEPGLAIGDYDEMPSNEREELTNERLGIFHVFGNVPYYDNSMCGFRDRVMGIVEDEATGKVYNVHPVNITFLK